MLESKIVWKLHLQSSLKCHAAGIRIGLANFLVAANKVDTLIITNGEPLKPKLSTQHVTQHPAIDVTGYAFHFIEGRHDRSRFCILNHMTKRHDLRIQQLTLSMHIRRAVSSTFCSGITCKMFEGRCHMVWGDFSIC